MEGHIQPATPTPTPTPTLPPLTIIQPNGGEVWSMRKRP